MTTVSSDRIRIKLKAYDYRILDKAVAEIVDTARNTGAGVAGPIPLPTNIHKYTIQRSVHVDKKSREQFEMRIHKRLMNPRSRPLTPSASFPCPLAWTLKSSSSERQSWLRKWEFWVVNLV